MFKADLIVNEAYLQRIPTFVDYTRDIQAYGEDNLYPQRAEFSRDRSFTTKTAVKRFSGFVAGQGFIDPILSQLVVNRKGHTMNDILRMISKDYGLFTGFALHFNYNLNYKVREINFIKFKFCRFGVSDRFGRVFDIKVNNNWERNPYKYYSSTYDDIFEYPTFNSDIEVVKDQVARYGGIMHYPGQILFFTPEENYYPTATFDAVFDYTQVQHELGVFDISKLQNGLTATTVFKYPGEFKTDAEEDEFYGKLRKHKGSKGANSTLVVQNPTRANLNLTETLMLQNLDKLHSELHKNAKDSIRESYSQPQEIHGKSPEGGMFQKASILEAYEYYNDITQEDRDIVSREVKKVIANWWQPLNISSFDIKQKQYGQAINNPGQSQGNPAGRRLR